MKSDLFYYGYNEEHLKHFNNTSIEKPKNCILNNENILLKFKENIINIEENSDINKEVLKILEENYDINFINKIKDNKEEIYIDEIKDSLNYLNETYINKDTYNICIKNLEKSFSILNHLKKDNKTNFSFLNFRPNGNFSFYDKSNRYTIFNNISLLTKYALQIGFKKILIIDTDLFHGFGTQKYFYENKKVVYFSSHKSPGYPKNSGFMNEIGENEGLGFNFNFPIDNSFNSNKYLEVYEQELKKIIRWNNPDLIIVSLGFNIIKGDTEVKSPINFEDFKTIINYIYNYTSEIKTVFSFEGGNKLDNVIKGTEYIISKYLTKKE